MIGALQNRQPLRARETFVQLVRFLHRHDIIGVAMQDQRGASDFARARGNIDAFQVLKQRNI